MKLFCTLMTVFMAVISSIVWSQNEYQTRIYREDIKTLQVKVNGNALAFPMIVLRENDELTVSFDEMSHEGHSFSYDIIHCNADWTQSSLSTSEYLQGFSRGYIDDYALSVNTTFLYTNYRFRLPNNDIQFKVSGNYAVRIFENNDSDNPIATLRFYVVDPKIEIQGTVRGNTDTEIYKTKQQVDFDIHTNNYPIQDAFSEIKVTVQQNDRSDNQVTNLKPTYFSVDKLSYVNNRNLIFEGGNEYRRVDFSSIYNFDERVEAIKFIRPHYEVFVAENFVRSDDSYRSDFDVNGRFVVNYQNGYDSDIEADYMYVHLKLPVDLALPNGNIYLGGNWNYNRMDDASRMNFDAYNRVYSKTLLLKQGGYNYQYWYLPENTDKVLVAPIEGSHWQTQNEYAVFVYHRPWGGRYDQLIGVKLLSN
ncbi:MAG: DUF5103 domain-containing protein [Paludibacteraceae bacterium]